MLIKGGGKKKKKKLLPLYVLIKREKKNAMLEF